jgi:2-polyprenyl-3-methyl-5-hydroxy-6-metoxy-1,4-benzoquinol methylase
MSNNFSNKNPIKSRIDSNISARSTWERRAVGSQRSRSKAGTINYYKEIRDYRYSYETPFIPDFFKFSDLYGKRVLEVGVGNGIDAVEMMKNGAKYTGIDITVNHLNLTKKYIQLEGDFGHKYDVEGIFEGDLLEVKLPGNYDVIYSFGVLHHISHEEDVLSCLHNLLSRNGELRIAVYSKFSVFNFWMFVTWIFRNKFKDPLKNWKSFLAEGSCLDEPVVIKIRTKKQIKTILEKSGFSIIDYKKKGFVQGYLPFIGKFFSEDGLVLNSLASVFGWYHCFICCRDDCNRDSK